MTLDATTQLPQPVSETRWVVFLFTDIEDCTLLWERAGDVFREVLVAHHALVREQIARHGGRELAEAGDGFLIAFSDVRHAAECAVGIQLAIDAAHFPAAVGAPRVRMGLHVGEVELRERGEYRGLVLNRAARIRDAAHGGQVLCSQAVAQAMEGAMEMLDLGLFRLRGVAAPERIHQLCWPGMSRRQFAPPRLQAAFTDNLPPSFTRFFGRKTEIERLRGWLLGHRKAIADGDRRGGQLVTLTGPGGTGKTRLSLAVAESLLEAFSHAVWFVSLAEITDANRLAGAVRDGLRLTPESGREPMEQILSALAAQPALLVLDNFEQLAPEGAGFVQVLLSRLPSLSCLVTSRQRLNLPGERELSLQPLPVPEGEPLLESLLQCESVQLFGDRAGAVNSAFELSTTNAAAVAELCRKLEGVPLALELAAARAHVVTPREMLGQLDRRLDAFSTAQRDMPARHRTLRAAIDWSYDFLPPALQQFFGNLSAFRGGWTVEAAEAIAHDLDLAAGSVLRALGELRSCSLISGQAVGETMRFSMLETIRQYASERLAASGNEDEVRLRHGRFFLHLADKASAAQRGTAEAFWMGRLDAEIENVRAVLAACPSAETRVELAISLPQYWILRGMAGEGFAISQELSAQASGITAKAAAGLHAAVGSLALLVNRPADARVHLERALELFRSLEDLRNVAALLNNLGIMAGCDHRLHDARALFQECLRCYETQGMEAQKVQALANLGVVAMDLGESQEALAIFEECLPLQERLGDQPGVALTLQDLGELAIEDGRLDDARTFGERSFEIAQRLKLQPFLGVNAKLFAILSAAEGRWKECARWIGSAEYLGSDSSLPRSVQLTDRFRLLEEQLKKHLPESEIAGLQKMGNNDAAAWLDKVPGSPMEKAN